jgi:3-hydroxyacyl-[acyl-carrier-protein] dehydratase
MRDDTHLLNENDIMDVLPHRYPFLLIDRIISCSPGKEIHALKNVTVNEPFFQGHFPGIKVMPGVLVIEAMAQAGGVLAHQTETSVEPKPLYYLVGVDKARFRRPVHPGDQLDIHIKVDRVVRGMWRFDCSASVAGQKVASAMIMTAPGSDTR